MKRDFNRFRDDQSNPASVDLTPLKLKIVNDIININVDLSTVTGKDLISDYLSDRIDENKSVRLIYMGKII